MTNRTGCIYPWVLMNNSKVTLIALLLLATSAYGASREELLSQLETTEDTEVATRIARQLEPEVPTWSILDQGRFHVRLGLVQEDLFHDLNSADKSFNHAIALLESLHDSSQALADAYYERAYVKYIRTHDTNVYCPDREKAVALTRQLNNQRTLAKYLASLAFCYTDSAARFEPGLALLNEAMALTKNGQMNADQRGMVYNATSLLYRKNQLYKQAYDYAQLSYDQWKSINDVQGMEDQQHNLLISAINMGELDKAEEHGRELFKLAETSPGNKDFKFFAYYDTGSVALAKNDLPRAISLFEQARAEEVNTEETVYIATNRAQLAYAYFMSGKSTLALQEATTVERLPGFTSMDLDKQQPIKALLQFQKHDALAAIRTLFNLVNSEHQLQRDFLRNAALDHATRHDTRVQQYENQLLENQLQIQQLQLSAQQRQQQATRWYLLLATATVLSLAMWAYTLRRSRHRFRKQAQTDALTGIANRRYFLERTDQLVKRSRDEAAQVSVLVLDVDHFKHINDTYGHQAGDLAIQHVVVNTLACLRDADLLGRTGGEEFAAILPATNSDDAWTVAERIRQRIESNPLNHQGDQIHITVSIGLAAGKLTTDDTNGLLQQADQAMYRAKMAGRNRCQFDRITTSPTVLNQDTIETV